MTQSFLMITLLGTVALGAGDADTAAARGWLGVYTEALSKPMLVALDVEGGALVAEVAENSPAAAAGIEIGDLLLSVDGKVVDSPSGLKQLIRERPGARVEVVCRRRGKERRVSATLDSRAITESPADFQWQGAPLEALREARKAMRELKPEVRKQFETRHGSMESLRKEVENLKQELKQLREQIQGKQKGN